VVRRTLAWIKEEPAGAELAMATLTARRLRVTGVAVHDAPEPYRLDYRLETGDGFETARLRVVARGAGWRRELDLARSPAGAWTIATRTAGDAGRPPPGGDAAALTGAIDCDLGLSPLTNSLPVLRLGLLRDRGPHELLMAWVSVPDLRVRPYAQRYVPAAGGPPGGGPPGRPVVRYEDATGDFAANLTFDADGFVVEYPGLARRLGRATLGPGRGSKHRTARSDG
jgi:hypothetical protein